MKFLKTLVLLLVMTFLTINAAYAQVFSFEAKSYSSTAIFPKGTMIKAKLLDSISTKDNKVGDSFSLITVSDLLVGKAVCIPEGSLLTGRIVRLEKAKEGQDGYFQAIIDKITFPDGWKTTMSATFWTSDGTGIIGGGATSGTSYKKVPHFIQGIGGVVQLVKTGPLMMGQERALPAGSEVIVVLENELKVLYLESLE
ncbi:MAG: hypothetical protein GX568_02355 [Candidatus Gastranaerophilales bacterium]|nr:hypothetical protein [Candidatus Gastranaerophilales bacterium]